MHISIGGIALFLLGWSLLSALFALALGRLFARANAAYRNLDGE